MMDSGRDEHRGGQRRVPRSRVLRRTRVRALPPGARRVAALVLLLFTLTFPFTTSMGQETDYDVKAAFVYNFIRYVEWPARAFRAADDAITLCIVGSDEAAEATAGLDGKTVRGRRIAVKRVNSAAGIEKCQILFVGRSAKAHARAIVGAVRGLPVLTVADIPGFARSGGAINFVLAEQRIAFEINQTAAERTGLRLSSRLLKMARIVREGE